MEVKKLLLGMDLVSQFSILVPSLSIQNHVLYLLTLSFMFLIYIKIWYHYIVFAMRIMCLLNFSRLISRWRISARRPSYSKDELEMSSTSGQSRSQWQRPILQLQQSKLLYLIGIRDSVIQLSLFLKLLSPSFLYQFQIHFQIPCLSLIIFLIKVTN